MGNHMSVAINYENRGMYISCLGWQTYIRKARQRKLDTNFVVWAVYQKINDVLAIISCSYNKNSYNIIKQFWGCVGFLEIHLCFLTKKENKSTKYVQQRTLPFLPAFEQLG